MKKKLKKKRSCSAKGCRTPAKHRLKEKFPLCHACYVRLWRQGKIKDGKLTMNQKVDLILENQEKIIKKLDRQHKNRKRVAR